MEDVFRSVFALIGCGAFYWWVRNMRIRWDTASRAERRVGVAVGVLILSVAYGLAEAALDDVPLYPRTIVVAAALSLLVWALRSDPHSE